MPASRVDRMAPPGWVRTDAHPTSFIMIIMGGNARSRANAAPQTALTLALKPNAIPLRGGWAGRRVQLAAPSIVRECPMDEE
jgi:hypothetical protein